MEPFLGELKLFPWDWAPRGWAICAGQLLPIATNTALFSLLGTTYGGDGRTTFALPDLRGRVPIHTGDGYVMGENGGQETVTLLISQLPTHNHAFLAITASGDANPPQNGLLANVDADKARYTASSTGLTPLQPTSVQPAGGSQPHNNMQPYLTLNFCIATMGIFPSRN